MSDNKQDFAPEDSSNDGVDSPRIKSRRAFKDVRRELSDDELSSPAGRKFLIGEIERLDEENERLIGFQNKYHEVNTELAIQKEKHKTKKSHEILYSALLTVGAALTGVAPSLDKYSWLWVAIVVLGIFLILGGIASRFVKR